MILAVVLFLWTPPHFWALAIAIRDDYAAAGVPMLPVVRGNAAAAQAILASTAALVVVSLLPAFFGLGTIYLVGALAGGAYFLHRARLLVRRPDRANAMRCFFASLVQLAALMITAVLDAQL